MKPASWVILMLACAGCLSGGESDPTRDARDTHDAISQEAQAFLQQSHEGGSHFDATLHQASRNIEVVGYSNGVDGSGDADQIPTDTYYTELAYQDGYVYLARGVVAHALQPLPTPVCSEVPAPSEALHGGFSIINVQNPANPVVVGQYNSLTGADIEVSRDNKLAFFATQRNCPTEIGGVLQTQQDPLDVLPRGIHVVDVSDPTAPELTFFQPLPINGPHTITYAQVDNTELLLVSTYDLYEDPGSNSLNVLPITQRVLIYEIVRDPDAAAAALVPRNTFFLTDRASGDRLYFPHDAIHQEHPYTGQELMYVAYWDKGVQIVDISDLNGPLPVVDGFTEFSPSSRNNIHQARPFPHLIDDVHVTVAEPEIISADETGYITFLDTSTPGDIQKLGSWTLPGDLFVNDFEFSPHNFALHDGKVFLAHNHAGVWVIDVGSKELLSDPQSVGYFLDVQPRTDAPRPQPWFWGTVVDDTGLVYAADESSGLYVLRYTGP